MITYSLIHSCEIPYPYAIPIKYLIYSVYVHHSPQTILSKTHQRLICRSIKSFQRLAYNW